MGTIQTPTPSTSTPPPSAPPLDPRKATKEQILAFLAQAKSLGIDPNRLNPSAKYILSIVPWDLTSQVFHHGGGLQTYSIPAAGDDDYHVLEIYDSVTRILDTTRTEEEIASDGHQVTPRHVAAQNIVDDLLQHWAGDHISNKSGHRIGLIQIAGPTPTDAELAKVRHQQRECFRWMVDQANGFHTRGLPQRITQEHRRALKNLRAEDPKKHPWYVEIGRATPDIPGGCPACSQPVPSTAYVCPTCRLNIAEHFHKRNRQVDPKSMPGIYEEIQFLKKTAPTVEDKIADGQARIAAVAANVSASVAPTIAGPTPAKSATLPK
jgi:hypothetical protein